MPQTVVTDIATLDADGVELSRTHTEAKQYTLVELRDQVDDEIESGAFDRAAEWIAAGNLEFWDGESDVEYLCTAIFPCAGITVKHTRRSNGELSSDYDVSWDLDRGAFFAVGSCTIDANRFLQALKTYLSGNDIRGPEYNKSSDWGYLAAVGTQKRKLDLRSKDARIIKEQGLVLLKHTIWGDSRSDEADFDYRYDEVSDQFKTDANELVSDLMSYALKVLRADMEDCFDTERILGDAEANGWMFDKRGKVA